MPSRCAFMPMHRHLWRCCDQSIPKKTAVLTSQHGTLNLAWLMWWWSAFASCAPWEMNCTIQRRVLWMGLRPSLTPFIVTNYWPLKSHQRNRNQTMNHWNKIQHWSHNWFSLSNPGVMRTWASFQYENPKEQPSLSLSNKDGHLRIWTKSDLVKCLPQTVSEKPSGVTIRVYDDPAIRP